LSALERVDLVYLHIEAPDEAAHEGDVELKIRAIETFDRRVVGPVVEKLEASKFQWRILLLPDHPTPISLRTHTDKPVPFAVMGEGIARDKVETFDEVAAARGGYGLVEANKLVEMVSN
jgi:2,3-bisphosphoglycerate-independent phosphoglycerate mutase